VISPCTFIRVLMQLWGDETYVLYLLCIFIRGHYPTANDFGSEVIPMAAKDYDVQVFMC
jgi:hypothetical protein